MRAGSSETGKRGRRPAFILMCAVAAAVPLRGWASSPGTIDGMTVTTAGVPLNGMCGKLYDAKGNNELIDFAPTGTDGISGHYIQQNVPPGKYVLLFVNCGANIDGVTPDQHYTPVLYGGTWNIRQASLVVVTSGATTNLLDQQIPYGGFVQGTVTDKTIKAPADTPPVAFVPPDGSKFFLRFSWTIVCGNPDGTYNSNTGFQQGVPAGATVIFAPDGWGCSDSQGNFNAGKWMAKKKAVDVSPGNTVTLNGSIVEAAP